MNTTKAKASAKERRRPKRCNAPNCRTLLTVATDKACASCGRSYCPEDMFNDPLCSRCTALCQPKMSGERLVDQLLACPVLATRSPDQLCRLVDWSLAGNIRSPYTVEHSRELRISDQTLRALRLDAPMQQLAELSEATASDIDILLSEIGCTLANSQQARNRSGRIMDIVEEIKLLKRELEHTINAPI